MPYRVSWMFPILVAAMLILPGFARAQSDEGSITLPLSPDPSRCTVEPRALAEVHAAWEEVMATAPATPMAEPELDLTGTPADDATVQEVTALIVQVLACSANGNDGLRDAALLTDDHMRDNLAEFPTEAEFSAWYTESPVANPPENWIMLYAVHEVRVLADGRIAAEPDVIVPGVGRFRDTLILARVDGELRIDDTKSGDVNLYESDSQ